VEVILLRAYSTYGTPFTVVNLLLRQSLIIPELTYPAVIFGEPYTTKPTICCNILAGIGSTYETLDEFHLFSIDLMGFFIVVTEATRIHIATAGGYNPAFSFVVFAMRHRRF
jgi:hypothetical protein